MQIHSLIDRRFFFGVFLANAGCSNDVVASFRNCFQQKRSDALVTFLREFFRQLCKP